MAKTTPIRQRKLEPSVLRMTFDLPADLQYLDLSQCASILNRRFYRQGLQWAIAGITFVDEVGGAAGTIKVDKLPQTWVCSNSWEKGFRSWDEANKEYALDAMPSIKARFYDFKVGFNDGHSLVGFSANLLPRDYGALTIGEWVQSEIAIPNASGSGAPSAAVEYQLHMLGDDVPGVSKGVIKGYAESRSVPQSPDPVDNAPALSWMNNIFDDGNQNTLIVNNVADQNDELPYTQLEYVGYNNPSTAVAALGEKSCRYCFLWNYHFQN